MLNTFRLLSSLLDRREKIQALLVLLLMLAVAVAETLGVVSIMPFIAILSDPSIIERNSILNGVYRALAFDSQDAFIAFIGAAVFVVLLVSLALKALAFWAQLRFSTIRGHILGCRLVGGYLGQPYQWFLNRHSSGLASTILDEVREVVGGALFPAMQFIAHILIVVLLVGLLLMVEPILALSASVVLGGMYAVILVASRKLLTRIGEERRSASRERFRAVQEAFGGIKDVKIAGLEARFTERFREPSLRVATRRVVGDLIAEIPAYAMQALLFGGMMLVLLYLIVVHGDFQTALPTVVLYAFAGYRLLPALQNAYRNFALLRFSQPTLEALHRDLQILDPELVAGRRRAKQGATERLPLREGLELRDVHYTYPNAERSAVRGLSLTICANTTVGFVGATGSGKTTTADLVLGLLQPARGALYVDGERLGSDNIRRWQRNLGYVPQQIYLSDDTVAANIAFGIAPNKIDRAAIERAARIANLHDFVLGELPQQYETLVGERGVRLSGGQRQRIGIARALYHDPDVLVFDEATSALDNLTEKAVMDAVRTLAGVKTIILIAHRLSTVRNCDCIYLLEQGSLLASGKFDELCHSNDHFREMAAIGS